MTPTMPSESWLWRPTLRRTPSHAAIPPVLAACRPSARASLSLCQRRGAHRMGSPGLRCCQLVWPQLWPTSCHRRRRNCCLPQWLIGWKRVWTTRRCRRWCCRAGTRLCSWPQRQPAALGSQASQRPYSGGGRVLGSAAFNCCSSTCSMARLVTDRPALGDTTAWTKTTPPLTLNFLQNFCCMTCFLQKWTPASACTEMNHFWLCRLKKQIMMSK